MSTSLTLTERAARRTAARWAASTSLGYAVLLVVFRALLAAQANVPILGVKFEIQLVAVVLSGGLLWPGFLVLARRQGFREGVGAYLEMTILGLFLLAGFMAALGAPQPSVQALLARLVSAQLPGVPQ